MSEGIEALVRSLGFSRRRRLESGRASRRLPSGSRIGFAATAALRGVKSSENETALLHLF
jgi:hypothetical protein